MKFSAILVAAMGTASVLAATNCKCLTKHGLHAEALEETKLRCSQKLGREGDACLAVKSMGPDGVCYAKEDCLDEYQWNGLCMMRYGGDAGAHCGSEPVGEALSSGVKQAAVQGTKESGAARQFRLPFFG